MLDASLSTVDSLVTIAGETAAPGNHNELGYDAAGNPLFLNAFDIDSRIGITRRAMGAGELVGDSVVLTFIATPNSASRANPQAGGAAVVQCQYRAMERTSRFSERANGPHEPEGPRKESDTGRATGRFHRRSADHRYYDLRPDRRGIDRRLRKRATPRFGENRLAFVASTATTSMIVRASQLDSDEDGLYDHWERAGGGIDMDQDGVIDLDLNAMGASVLTRIFFGSRLAQPCEQWRRLAME